MHTTQPNPASLHRPAPGAGRYSHSENRSAVVRELAPILCGLLRQARGAGNTDASVLERLTADETLRGQLAAVIGRRHVFGAETAREAFLAAREIARQGAL